MAIIEEVTQLREKAEKEAKPHHKGGTPKDKAFTAGQLSALDAVIEYLHGLR
jgi:cbb3-type cytochrome oxidase cytochrome c subunit